MSSLVFFDLESTGPKPDKDRIIQFAFLLMNGEPWDQVVNPGVAIPAEASAVHGFTDADVAAAPPFSAVASRVAALIEGRPLVGYNIRHFDWPLLAEEFERAEVPYPANQVLIDLDPLYKKFSPRRLADALRELTGQELENAHQAGADAKAAKLVYFALKQMFPALEACKTPEKEAALSCYERPPADPFGHLRLVAGKVSYGHKGICDKHNMPDGVPVELDPGYGDWMLGKNFPRATKRVLRAELARIDAEARAAEPAGLFDGNPF